MLSLRTIFLVFLGFFLLSTPNIQGAHGENCPAASFAKLAMKRPKHTQFIQKILEDPVAIYEDFLKRADAYNKGKPLVANNFSVQDYFSEDMEFLLKEIQEIENYFSVRGDMEKYREIAEKMLTKGQELLKKGLPYMDYIAFTKYYTQLQDFKIAVSLGERNIGTNPVELYQISRAGIIKNMAKLEKTENEGIPLRSIGSAPAMSNSLRSYLSAPFFDTKPSVLHIYGTDISKKGGLPFFRLPSISGLNREDYCLLMSVPFQHETLPKKISLQDAYLMTPSANIYHDRKIHYGTRKDNLPIERSSKYEKILQRRHAITKEIVLRIRNTKDENLRLFLSVRLFHAVHERSQGVVDLLVKPGADILPTTFSPIMTKAEKMQLQKIPEEEQKNLIYEAGELLKKWYKEIESKFRIQAASASP